MNREQRHAWHKKIRKSVFQENIDKLENTHCLTCGASLTEASAKMGYTLQRYCSGACSTAASSITQLR